MAVTSFDFLIFFPIVVLIYYVIPKRFGRIWLLAASYYFYMSWDVKFGFILLAVTAITYFGALGITWLDERSTNEAIKARIKKICVAVISLAIFSILFCCKYLIFVIGISFYTLQSLGYIIDVYRGKTEAERNFLQYALFCPFSQRWYQDR